MPETRTVPSHTAKEAPEPGTWPAPAGMSRNTHVCSSRDMTLQTHSHALCLGIAGNTSLQSGHKAAPKAGDIAAHV